MARSRKPGFWVTTEETRRNCRNGMSKHESAYIYADTYRKLKQELKTYIPLSVTDEVTICRQRRGNWGEYYETWRMVQGKPKIVKQGWM